MELEPQDDHLLHRTIAIVTALFLPRRRASAWASACDWRGRLRYRCGLTDPADVIMLALGSGCFGHLARLGPFAQICTDSSRCAVGMGHSGTGSLTCTKALRAATGCAIGLRSEEARAARLGRRPAFAPAEITNRRKL